MILPEDYRDEMLKKGEKKRKYNIIDNSDGTKSFDDVTDYLQKGSKLGAKQINDITHEINNLHNTSGYLIEITFDEKFKRRNFTLTDGDETYTGIVPENLVATVRTEKSNNTYTVSIVYDDGFKHSIEVKTGQYYGQYRAKFLYANVFGVMWDYGNDSSELMRLTRENDPYHYVNTNILEEPHPAVGTGSGSSPFDDYMPWKGMEEYNIVGNTGNVSFIKKGEQGFSRTQKDTYVYIPTFYYRVIDEPNKQKRYWYISDKPTKGFELHPGSNKYIGKYLMDSNCGVRSGALGWDNVTIETIRDTIRSVKGNNFGIQNYQLYCAILILYLIEFADFDSQKKIGDSLYGIGFTVANGGTDTLNYHTGTVTNNGKSGVLYRNIENLWGNATSFCDGINIHNTDLYVCDWKNHEKYQSYTIGGYEYIGKIPNRLDDIERTIRALGYSSLFSYAFYPAATGGSTSTYVPDLSWSSKEEWAALTVSGYPVSKENRKFIGIFFFDADVRTHYPNQSARPMYYPE